MPSTRHTKNTSNIQYTPKTKQTHAKNPTMTPTSTAPVLTDDKQENVTVEGILEEQQRAIAYLKRKVELLEGKIFQLEGQVHISQTVNTLLEAKIDDQEQYSRRPCLVISGLALPGEEDELQKVATATEDETGITGNTVIRNIDKAHPIGQADENGKQKRIVKFTSDSFTESVYRKHKKKHKKHVAELKQKKQSVRIGIKFQPLLTTRRRKLLELANGKFAGVDQIQFTYAGIHGNIKVMLKSPVQRRYVLQIHTKNDIANISANSIPVMVIDNDNYNYASLGSLVFTVQLEKKCGIIYMWSRKWCLVRCLR